MRWILLVCLTAFVAGCYAPPRAKPCATCKAGSRPASRATHVK